jgi:hypothetical protein
VIQGKAVVNTIGLHRLSFSQGTPNRFLFTDY